MFTLNDFNLFVGLSWDEDCNEKIDLTFHEQDGVSDKVSGHCKGWCHTFNLQSQIQTAHLPCTMTFKVSELKTLFRRLKLGYSNMNVPLPFRFDQSGFEVVTGPARGTRIHNVTGG